MIAGSVLGGLGAYMLQNNSVQVKKMKRKMKNKAVKMANTVYRQAGTMLNMAGDALSNRIH